MGVEDDPIGIGEVASPGGDAGESVTDGDVETLADAGDLSEDVVSLDVTARRVVSRNDQRVGI